MRSVIVFSFCTQNDPLLPFKISDLKIKMTHRFTHPPPVRVLMNTPLSRGENRQPHSPGWARVPLSSFFPQISIKFSYFSSTFYSFSSSFWPSGWASRPPEKAPGYATENRLFLPGRVEPSNPPPRGRNRPLICKFIVLLISEYFVHTSRLREFSIYNHQHLIRKY